MQLNPNFKEKIISVHSKKLLRMQISELWNYTEF